MLGGNMHLANLTRRAITLVAALLLAGATVFTMAGPASAAAYDGTDPASTGCSSGAYTAKSAYGGTSSTSYLLVELRYSPSCRTAWARITSMNMPACVPGADFCGLVTVHRNSDGREYSCYIPSGGHGCYTRQVNDSGVTSYSTGSVDNGARSYYATTGSY
jgi:hypothetical protein